MDPQAFAHKVLLPVLLLIKVMNSFKTTHVSKPENLFAILSKCSFFYFSAKVKAQELHDDIQKFVTHLTSKSKVV